jgi:DNA-binding winged helix-turn-helix (wHTH) protein
MLKLTRLEFRLLFCLLRAGGKALSREEIIQSVWGADAEVLDRTVDAHVRSLRRKLKETKGLLETVQGVGYRIQKDGAGPEKALREETDAALHGSVNTMLRHVMETPSERHKHPLQQGGEDQTK